MDHVDGRILDPKTGEELPVGFIGEICVRGYCVMQGYYGMPDKTREVIDCNAFLHTGDLGFLDEHGNVHFTGRRKEVIICGGENIYPGEIEACIREDCRVKDVKVIGLPDDHCGEAVCACVVCEPGTILTPDDVQRYLSCALSYYKVPKHVLFFDSLPTSSTGKVQFIELADLVKAKIQENK